MMFILESIMGHTIDTLVQVLKEQFDTPKQDLEKNLRAIANEWVTKMDLVSKDELERQKTALMQANQRLVSLQAQVKALEEQLQYKK